MSIDLDAIRQRADAATPGPWRVVEEHGRDISDEGWSRIAIQSEAGNRAEVAEIIGDDVSYGAEEWNANAEFVAHAREDIPDLLAEVKRLRDEVADLRAIADAAIHYVNCDDKEAETGEPYELLVHAVAVYERKAEATR